MILDEPSYAQIKPIFMRLETIQAVKEGIASAERGEGKPLDEAFDALEKDLRRAKARQ